MKLLDSQETSTQIVQLIQQHTSVCFAVAWASYNTKVFDALRDHKKKIRYGVIGTHFCQTQPIVLEWCLEHDAEIGFVLETSTNSVFHPKVYLFYSKSDWDLLIGSANMTSGGLSNNTELMLHVSNEETDSMLKEEALQIIRDYWNDSEYVNSKTLSKYTKLYKKAKRKKIDTTLKNGDYPETLEWQWRKYYTEIIGSCSKREVDVRIDLLKRCRDTLNSVKSFRDLSQNSRRALAGSHRPKEGEWSNVEIGYFGWTYPYGIFTNLVYENDPVLSDALDCMPLIGRVEKRDYMRYTETFVKAFDGEKHGLGVSARLLTIMRPDMFVPWNGQTKKNLAEILCLRSMIKPTEYERYWDEVIAPLTDSLWWHSQEPPKGSRQHLVWTARVAMLEVIVRD